MTWTIKIADGFIHSVEFSNLVKILFVLLSIPNGQSDPSFAKSPGSSDPMEIALGVSNNLILDLFERNVVIYDKFNLWNVNASCNEVSSN